MYTEFKQFAVEDAIAGYRYGIECLFRYYSYGLERKFKADLYRDFQEEVIRDYKSGNLYGLEKFWAFLKYYKGKTKFEVNADLKEELEKFKDIEDFRIQAEGDNRVKKILMDELVDPIKTIPSHDSKSDTVKSDEKASRKDFRKSDDKRRSFSDEKRKPYSEDRKKVSDEKKRNNEERKNTESKQKFDSRQPSDTKDGKIVSDRYKNDRNKEDRLHKDHKNKMHREESRSKEDKRREEREKDEKGRPKDLRKQEKRSKDEIANKHKFHTKKGSGEKTELKGETHINVNKAEVNDGSSELLKTMDSKEKCHAQDMEESKT